MFSLVALPEPSVVDVQHQGGIKANSPLRKRVAYLHERAKVHGKIRNCIVPCRFWLRSDSPESV